MSFTRMRVWLAAGAVALASTVTATLLAAGPASAKPAAPAAPQSAQAVLVTCSSTGAIRPTTFDFGCMPSSQFLGGLKWTSWSTVAFGSGDLKVNNCDPSCASGKYISYPVLLVLWRPAAWPGHAGKEYVSRMTWIFTGTRPPHTATTSQTFTLSSTGAP